MNLILFSSDEIARPLPLPDPRAVHLRETLRRSTGDSFVAGIVNGPQGAAKIESITDDSMHLSFSWQSPPPPLPAITLIIGLPRPQTARDILRDATTLGATALHFVRTEKSEPSYARSNLWTSDEWRRHVLNGAMQACDTRVPEVSRDRALRDALSEQPSDGVRVALDVYEGNGPLSAIDGFDRAPVCIAIGPERGWTAADRENLRSAGFMLAHLGTRVLRTETAVIAALTLVRARRGFA